MPRYLGEAIPAGPFVAVINAEIERIGRADTLRPSEIAKEVPAQAILAGRIGVAERTLYRYRKSLNSENQPTETFARDVVENALERLDFRFEDVYPEIAAAEDIALEDDAYCAGCREIVTPIDGICPWCERQTTSKIPARLYCKREDAMRFPALDGQCWRCGGKLRKHIPRGPCACGCGTSLQRFNSNSGLPVAFMPGHSGGPWRSKRTLPAGPFVDWLERELRDLDPVQALSRRVGIPRDELLALLNRRVHTIPQTQVNKSLRLAGIEGQGQKVGTRAGSTRINDLYPDRGGALKCPRCGGHKTAHAALCRPCRNAEGMSNRQPSRPTSMTPEVLAEARRLRELGLKWDAVAERVHPRTRCAQVESVRSGLIAAFGKHGWQDKQTRYSDRSRGPGEMAA